MNELTFRDAERADVGLVLHFIKQLAAYEKMLDEVIATEGTGRMDFRQRRSPCIFRLSTEEVGFACTSLIFHLSGPRGPVSEECISTPNTGDAAAAKRSSGNWRASHWKRLRPHGMVCLNWNEPSIDFISPWAHTPWTIGHLPHGPPVIEKLAADTKDTGEPQVTATASYKNRHAMCRF